MRRISIFLVDDHAAIRRGFGSLLQSQADFALVGETDHGSHAVRLISKARPDVVVLDIPRLVVDGSHLARRIIQIVPGVRIVALTSYGEDEQVVQLIQVGVVGLLIKQTAVNDLVRAIRGVQGGPFFSPLIAKRLKHQGSPPGNVFGKNRELGFGRMAIAGKQPLRPTLYPPLTSTEASRRALAAA